MSWIDTAIEFVIPLLFAIIVYHIIPLLKEKKLYDYVETGVRAAEQVFKGSGRGEEKFNYVRTWIKNKFKISDGDLQKLIDAVVFEMNQKKF